MVNDNKSTLACDSNSAMVALLVLQHKVNLERGLPRMGPVKRAGRRRNLVRLGFANRRAGASSRLVFDHARRRLRSIFFIRLQEIRCLLAARHPREDIRIASTPL